MKEMIILFFFITLNKISVIFTYFNLLCGNIPRENIYAPYFCLLIYFQMRIRSLNEQIDD